MPAGKTQRMLCAAGALVTPTDARPGAAVAHAIAGGAAPSTDLVRRPRHRRAGAGPWPAGCFPAPAAVELGWRDHSTHALLGPFAATLLAPRAATALPCRRAVPSAAAERSSFHCGTAVVSDSASESFGFEAAYGLEHEGKDSASSHHGLVWTGAVAFACFPLTAVASGGVGAQYFAHAPRPPHF